MPINYDEYLQASNGLGEAVRAHVVVEREVGGSEINVDTVLNWPSKFIATSGMLDPDTGTFDPDTVTVFYGHISGTYVGIDEFAPGYADIGNQENEIIVIKPTTPWADKMNDKMDDAYLDEISEAEIDAGTSDVRKAISGRRVGYIINKIQEAVFLWTHPIGSIYFSVDNTNPGTVYGGTWVAWGAGRVPVGVDTGQTEFDTVEETGGEKTHTLTTAEMPAHNHPVRWSNSDNDNPVPTTNNTLSLNAGSTANRYAIQWNANTGGAGRFATSSAGGGGAHNNLQPYITCYMWKRTA